jgi:hypothetical protein
MTKKQSPDPNPAIESPFSGVYRPPKSLLKKTTIYDFCPDGLGLNHALIKVRVVLRLIIDKKATP